MTSSQKYYLSMFIYMSYPTNKGSDKKNNIAGRLRKVRKSKGECYKGRKQKMWEE